MLERSSPRRSIRRRRSHRNVTIAPLSEIVIFGAHVLVTVCEAAFVPVPPHETGALMVPVLGVIVTEPCRARER